MREPYHKEPQLVIVPMGDGIDSDEVKENRKRLDEKHRANIGQKNQTPKAGEQS